MTHTGMGTRFYGSCLQYCFNTIIFKTLFFNNWHETKYWDFLSLFFLMIFPKVVLSKICFPSSDYGFPSHEEVFLVVILI